MSLVAEDTEIRIASRRTSVILPRCVGGLLIFAAAWKAHGISASLVKGAGFGSTASFELGLVACEAGLAVWLFSGRRLRDAWAVTTILFSCFVAVSFYGALRGKPSCGCFGTLEVPPGYVALLDSIVLALLSLNWPNSAAHLPAKAKTLLVAVGLSFLLVVGMGLAPLVRGDDNAVAVSFAHDFGPMSPKESAGATHVFQVRNEGSKAVNILDVSSSCGCTVAQLASKSIPPQGAIDVTVRADWGSRVGLQRSSVTLKTDDLNRQLLTLDISGTVVVPVAVSPSSIAFGAMRSGEVQSRDVVVSTVERGTPFQVLGVTTSDPNVTATPIGPPFDSASIPYRITFKAPRSQGTYRGSVTFKTSLATTSEVGLPVEANLVAPLRAVPSSLLFARGDSKPYPIVLSNTGGSAVTATLASGSEHPDFYIDRKIENYPVEGATTILVGARDAGRGSLGKDTLRLSAGSELLEIPLLAIDK